MQGDLEKFAENLPPQRVLRLFYLGLGLAKLLRVSQNVSQDWRAHRTVWIRSARASLMQDLLIVA